MLQSLAAALLLAAPCLAKEITLPDSTGLRTIEPKFSLNDGDWGYYDRFADRWQKTHERVGLGQVLRELKREAKEDCWEGSGPDSRAHSTKSFCWSDVPDSAQDDEDNRYWYPQGIASSGESRWSAVSGRTVLLVSWYKRKDKDSSSPSTASRISVVDATDGRRVRYRHVALVEPECDSCPDWKSPEIHAGGAAWSGRYLYIVDTKKGLRVFDLTRFLRKGGGLVLPQVAFYKDRKGSDLAFSYASAAGGALVTGEYVDRDDGAKVVHWPLKADGRLKTADGRVKAVKAYATKGELRNLQGVAIRSGVYYFTRSRSTRYGELIAGKPGSRFHSFTEWSIGPEDLSNAGGLLWGLTEHPQEGRSVYATKLSR